MGAKGKALVLNATHGTQMSNVGDEGIDYTLATGGGFKFRPPALETAARAAAGRL